MTRHFRHKFIVIWQCLRAGWSSTRRSGRISTLIAFRGILDLVEIAPSDEQGAADHSIFN